MRYWTASRSAALATLLLFVLLFVGISVDLVVRVLEERASFESPHDVVFLLYMEGLREVVTLAGIVLAVLAAARARVAPAFGVLAFGLGFATLAYTKLIGFGGFPGNVQEGVAIWLRTHGVPHHVLAVLFAHPEWACWLALAGFLLFAARYPRPLVVADIARSGARDRTGAMRSVALAGADIGALARAAAAVALRRRWLRGRVVWSAALLVALAHTAALRAVRAPAVNLLAVLIAVVPIAVLVALFRASLQAADAGERVPLLWLRRGVFAGLVLFATSAFATPLLPRLPLGAIALPLAPAALAACWLVAVLRAPRLPCPVADHAPV
jgi:hypothetical protein